MLPAIALSVLIVLLSSAFAWSDTDSVYPANPSVKANSIFIAGRGVARFDLVSGGMFWSALPQELLYEPLVAGSRVVAAGNGGLFALDSESGSILWQHGFPTDLFSPVLAGGRLIVTAGNGTVYAVAIETGEILWEKKSAQGWLYPPAAEGGLLITGGQGRVVLALDAKTGALRWQREVAQELVYSPLATGSGGVIVTTFSGDVTLLKSEDGRELWRTRFDTPSVFPSLVGRYLLLSGLDGVLRALDPASGELVWQQTLPARLTTPVSGSDGLLTATVDGGEVFVLDFDSGAILKNYRLGAEAVGGALLADNRVVVFVERRNEHTPVPVYFDVY